jgi:undecaprenyldiphospho-muramoylpentapeptide beta-N-acetylglucosaminyltransferase
MTGGGVYPALAVLQTMNITKQDVLWIGSENPMEAKLLSEQAIPFEAIPAAGLHGVGIASLPGNTIRIFQGYQRAKRIIGKFQPDVAFYTGGYISFPVSLAARQTTSITFIPDIEPGTALKFMIPRSDLITLTTEDSRKFISKSKRVEVTGYPIRPSFQKWDKSRGKLALGLHDRKPVLLVFGGSKGSRSINNALQAALPRLLEEIQVIHISGEDNWETVKGYQNNLPQSLVKDYHPYAFLNEEMGAALSSADLVVCRAGASTLGELPFFKLPAILVPYPHAWQYQHTNAEYLARHGGAIVLMDEDLQKDLYSSITLLLHDKARLQKMSEAMQTLSHPDAAKRIGDLIISASKTKGGKPVWLA